jgi:hypothetical protein
MRSADVLQAGPASRHSPIAARGGLPRPDVLGRVEGREKRCRIAAHGKPQRDAVNLT